MTKDIVMKKYPFFIVNAFSDNSQEGNPAGVILLDDINIDFETLKKLVIKTNLPEVSFISIFNSGLFKNKSINSEKKFYIRWLTQKTELDICGHGTIGAAYRL